MRSMMLLIAMVAVSLMAVEIDSAADSILVSYEAKIAAWENRTDSIPTYRMRYNFISTHSAAIKADDETIGVASKYALDFNQRIIDDLTAWQNSAVPMVTLAEFVPRMKNSVAAIQMQMAIWGD